MTTMEEIKQISEFLDQINDDTSIPRNIRRGASECKDLLIKSEDEIDVRIASSIFKLEVLADDPNIPLHGRTMIWNIISRLESIKN